MGKWLTTILFILITPLASVANDSACKLEPQAPLKDFFLPSFSDEGIKVWDARGAEAAIAKDGKHVSLQDLHVRLFDELDANTLKIVLESTSAEIDTTKNQIYGNDFIHVVGHLFTAMGSRWTFFGEDNTIILERDIQVFFETDLSRTLLGQVEDVTGSQESDFTAISSNSLQITDSTHGLVFDFLQAVEIKSNDFELSCDELEVQTGSEAPIVMLEQKISNEHIKEIRAIGHVHLQDACREVDADCVEFFPSSGVVVLNGNVCLVDSEGTLRGKRIILRNQEKHLVVENNGTIRSEISLDIN